MKKRDLAKHIKDKNMDRSLEYEIANLNLTSTFN